MDKLRDYLKSMEFKKRAVGGVDEENVLGHIKKICDIVREEMEEQDRVFEAATHKMQEDLDELQEQLKKYRLAYQKLRDINEKMDARMRELQGEAERYGRARERADQEQRKYQAKHQELLAAVDTLHSVTADAEKAARKEMRAALSAEEESARGKMLAGIERERAAASLELQQLRGEIADLTRKRQAMRESIRREREEWKQHLDWFARRLETEEDAGAWPPPGDLQDSGGFRDPLKDISGYDADLPEAL